MKFTKIILLISSYLLILLCSNLLLLVSTVRITRPMNGIEDDLIGSYIDKLKDTDVQDLTEQELETLVSHFEYSAKDNKDDAVGVEHTAGDADQNGSLDSTHNADSSDCTENKIKEDDNEDIEEDNMDEDKEVFPEDIEGKTEKEDLGDKEDMEDMEDVDNTYAMLNTDSKNVYGNKAFERENLYRQEGNRIDVNEDSEDSDDSDDDIHNNNKILINSGFLNLNLDAYITTSTDSSNFS